MNDPFNDPLLNEVGGAVDYVVALVIIYGLFHVLFGRVFFVYTWSLFCAIFIFWLA